MVTIKSIRNKILALDFDGVICNSLIECALVSYNAYSKIFLDEYVYLTKKEGMEITRFKKFSDLRPYVRKGWEYIILHKIIDENISINNQEGCMEFIKKFEREKIERIFYKERKKFKELNPLEWFNANPCYPSIINCLKKTKKRVYIVTTKKKKYVSEILSYNKIEIKENNILTTFFKKSKKDLLFYIIEKEGIKLKDIIFVDDHIQHLISIKDLGVSNYLASWGYINEEHLIKARRNNISVITEKEFCKMLV